MRASSPISMEK